MTPWQLGIAITACVENLKAKQELLAWHAWNTAALYRCKTMPRLSELIGRSEDNKLVEQRLKTTLKAFFNTKKEENG